MCDICVTFVRHDIKIVTQNCSPRPSTTTKISYASVSTSSIIRKALLKQLRSLTPDPVFFFFFHSSILHSSFMHQRQRREPVLTPCVILTPLIWIRGWRLVPRSGNLGHTCYLPPGCVGVTTPEPARWFRATSRAMGREWRLTCMQVTKLVSSCRSNQWNNTCIFWLIFLQKSK